MISYEIIRVGVPARKQDVTQSFLDSIQHIKNSKDAIGLVTVDFSKSSFEYSTAPYGYRLIFDTLQTYNVDINLKPNVLNCFGDVWDRLGASTPNESVSKLLEFFDMQYNMLKYKHLYLFTNGSPFIFDDLTNILTTQRTLNIIDCESPIKICANNMKEYLNLQTYIIHNTIPEKLENKKLHVFPCISENYGINVDSYFNVLGNIVSKDDKFLYCSILEDGSSYLKCMSFTDATIGIDTFKNTNNAFTFGVYKL